MLYLNRDRRRGLAPLELVLGLPALLFTMALIWNVGAAACWKIRGSVAAHNAGWRTRFDRQDPGRVRPYAPLANWPAPATAGGGVDQQQPSFAQIDHPALLQPVGRGPTIPGPQASIEVKESLLDPRLSRWVGSSDLERPVALLPSLRTFRPTQRQPMLDHRWQFPAMGLGSTIQRRIPIIYTLPTPEPIPSLASILQNVQSALAESSVGNTGIMTLDYDQEIYNWIAFVRGSGQYKRFNPPRFDPKGWFCESNPQMVRDRYVDPLIDQIQGKVQPHIAGVGENMANYFITMYQQQIQYFPDRQSELQPIIQQLQQYAARARMGG